MSMLAEEGVVVTGQNPLNTLGTRLSRLDWVTNLKGLGYWLKDRDYEPAGHEAGDLDLGPGKLKPIKDGEEAHPMFPGHRYEPKAGDSDT